MLHPDVAKMLNGIFERHYRSQPLLGKIKIRIREFKFRLWFKTHLKPVTYCPTFLKADYSLENYEAAKKVLEGSKDVVQMFDEAMRKEIAIAEARKNFGISKAIGDNIMPNNVLNEVIFRGVGKEAQDSIIEKVVKGDFVDFNVLVPMPLNIWKGDLGTNEEKAFGKKNWNDWSHENWGTKWNAYYGKKSDEFIARTESTLTIRFQTAWSPPRPWLAALFNATGLPFEHNWLSEGHRYAHAAKFYFDDELQDGDPSPAWTDKENTDKEFNERLQILLWGAVIDKDETP